MMIDRRQFFQGVLATGLVAVGMSAIASNGSLAATSPGSATKLAGAEAWLLTTGRRALG